MSRSIIKVNWQVVKIRVNNEVCGQEGFNTSEIKYTQLVKSVYLVKSQGYPAGIAVTM